MIAKVLRGSDPGGLVRYLYSRGKADEHESPRVIAGWRPPEALEVPLTARGARDFRPLVQNLKTPLGLAGVGERGVWHCSLRAAPEDKVLTDRQWATIAEEVMERTGLATKADEGGVRWAAIRHGDDHVHIVATLARQDGRRAYPHNDFYRVGEACRIAEQRYGLRATAPRDRTAAHRSTRAETEKAKRLSHEENPRAYLRREVQAAAGASGSEDEFFSRLKSNDSILVHKRYSELRPEELTGYAVARKGFTDKQGQPIYYGGGKLAADLSLPKLQAHWAPPTSSAPPNKATPSAKPPRAQKISMAIKLRHEAQIAAASTNSTQAFFAKLQQAGVLVKPRFSQINPNQITGYAIALAGHQDQQGQPIWHAGGKLAPELSLPQLEHRWAAKHRAGQPPRITSPLSAQDRQSVWQEAEQAARASASKIRSAAPSEAEDAARCAADLLNVTSKLSGPQDPDEIKDAAKAYDRASRTPYAHPAPRGTAGQDLRLAAVSLALLGRCRNNEAAARRAMLIAMGVLIEAVADLKIRQGRLQQAEAATSAQNHLKRATQLPAEAARGREPTRNPSRRHSRRPTPVPPTPAMPEKGLRR